MTVLRRAQLGDGMTRLYHSSKVECTLFFQEKHILVTQRIKTAVINEQVNICGAFGIPEVPASPMIIANAGKNLA